MESKSNVKITFLGGMNHVGGNMILFEDCEFDVRVFLDFGMNIGQVFRFYKKDSGPSSAQELIDKQLLPNPLKFGIPDLYQTSFQITSPNSMIVDSVLISHPHKDHYLGIPFLNRKIPVRTGVTTKNIIESLSQSEYHNSLNNFDGINWKTFRTGDIIQIKNLIIVPFHVDHSVPASYGFILYSSAGPIVYTGDFRRHGPLAFMSEEFLDQIKTHQLYRNWISSHPEVSSVSLDRVKLLICEGTKIFKGIVESEQLVESNLEILSQKNPFDYMIIKYERTDWDRFRTFSNFAKKYGWQFILGERDAYFYYVLNKDSAHTTMQDPNILKEEHILVQKWRDAQFPWQQEFRQEMYRNKQGQRLFDSFDSLLFESKKKSKTPKYLIYITHLNEELEKWIQDNSQNRGVFISSSVDPYSEQMYDNSDKISQELLELGLPSYKIHASGHLNSHALIDFIDQIHPETLVPIHTDHPKLFSKLFEKNNIEVKLPNEYETLSISIQ